MNELQTEIEELKKDIVFLRDLVDRELFDVYATGVRNYNHDSRYDYTSPFDKEEIRYNRIEQLWEQNE